MKKCKALVVGINTYEHYPHLNNAVHDAEELGKTLQELHFEVEFCLDEDRQIVHKYIENFEESLSSIKYDVALFFFAGHGCNANGNDCLMLKEAPIYTSDNSVIIRNRSIVISDLYKKFNAAGDQINILIIDACRTEGIRGVLGVYDFGKNSHAPYQTFIAYSTSPGSTANDGRKHSPYITSLISHIKEEGLSIENLFKKVRKEVRASCGQIPWEHSCLSEEFSFNYGQTDPAYEFGYSQNILADTSYIGSNEISQKIISLFKKYDFCLQMEALILFKKHHKILNKDDKFVIGRNILQAAAGNCWMCIDELTPTKLSIYQEQNENSVLDGIFYEIYFDKNNQFRKKNLKGTCYLDKIDFIAKYGLFNSSVKFIRKMLEPYMDLLNYRPGDIISKIISIELIHSKVDTLLNNNIWMIDKILNEQEDVTDVICDNFISGNRKDLIDNISLSLGIPASIMKLNFSKSILSNDVIEKKEKLIESFSKDEK